MGHRAKSGIGDASSGLGGGLSALLAGVSMMALTLGTDALAADGSAGDSSSAPIQVPKVSVTETAPAPEGSAEAGYKPEMATTTGPWGTMPIQDTPYSIGVISGDLIDNRIISSTDQIFAADPLTQLYRNQSRGYGSIIYIRGLPLTNGFTELNGMRVSGDLIMPVEDKERVETLAGLSGFLYGPGNAGGLVNYDIKRPTPTMLNEVTVGNYGGGQYFGHADVGGPIDGAGKFGYRLNVVRSDGNTGIDDNDIDKYLVSAAFDYHVTDNLLVQVDYSHQHYHETGTQADWGAWTGSVPHFSPSILDPTKNYSQRWTYNKNDMDVAGTNVTYTVTPDLQLRTAYQFTRIEDENAYIGNNIGYNNGRYTYSLTAHKNAPAEHLNNSGYGFADYSFDALSIHNKLTVGYYTDSYELNLHQDSSQNINLGTYSLSPNPTSVAAPAFTVGTLPVYTSQTTWNQNYVIGDEITLNDQWSALVGLNHTEIDTRNFSISGATSSHYDKTAFTPSASLLFKPIPPLTTYVTYLESLENSGTASLTYNGQTVTNANQTVSPTLSRQYEVGAKATIGRMLLTTALFEIDKANTYYAANNNGATYTYTTDGEQTNRGVEVTATGKVTPDLTLSGGIVLLDAKITKTNTAYLQNQPPFGAAQAMGKLYAEYAIPPVPGLTLTGGATYVGRQVDNNFAVPATARDWLPSYITGDLGLRFAAPIYGTETIFRLNVTNVTGERYWQQSDLTGAPRTVAFSVSAKF